MGTVSKETLLENKFSCHSCHLKGQVNALINNAVMRNVKSDSKTKLNLLW